MIERSEQRLRHIVDAGLGPMLATGLKGLEKESLRIERTGAIAQTPHPRALGSALTHPHITTDYSEALIELITAPHASPEAVLAELGAIHKFVYDHIGEELLWATSMPCDVADDRNIPIATYGTSNIGRLKHVYRVGLDYRYGRRMQAIAGVHFNYSLPESIWAALQTADGDNGPARDFISRNYFGLVRNFKRLSWLVPYLFGSSPAVCKSFPIARPGRFKELDPYTWYMPYATSLRMSDIGYQNKNQAALAISYDSIEAYVESLTRAIQTPYPEYEALGVKTEDGYRQLNANVLQIENEFYSYIRPKQTTRSGERPTIALKARGVEYVEMRALDLDPFAPVGVDVECLRFNEAFLLLCALMDSAPISAEEQRYIDYNQLTVALRGREPGLKLRVNGRSRPLQECAAELCDRTEPICAALDGGNARGPYSLALAAQREKLHDPARLPSARVLALMRERDQTFGQFALGMSVRHKAAFAAQSMPPEVRAAFVAAAARSLAEQAEIEAADTLDFDTYLAEYFARAA